MKTKLRKPIDNGFWTQALEELGVPPEKVLISNKLAWKRVPLPHPGAEPTFEPGAWVNLKNDAVQVRLVHSRIQGIIGIIITR